MDNLGSELEVVKYFNAGIFMSEPFEDDLEEINCRIIDEEENIYQCDSEEEVDQLVKDFIIETESVLFQNKTTGAMLTKTDRRNMATFLNWIKSDGLLILKNVEDAQERYLVTKVNEDKVKFDYEKASHLSVVEVHRLKKLLGEHPIRNIRLLSDPDKNRREKQLRRLREIEEQKENKRKEEKRKSVSRKIRKRLQK